MKIIIIEDDTKIREELARFLRSNHYEVEAPDRFEQIVNTILNSGAQLVLLDLNLPENDGYYICRELRSYSSIPVIVVTSRDSEVDELMSMNLGADDFITKPFNTQILLARMASVLKRAYPAGDERLLSYRGLVLDLAKSTAACQGRETDLTKNELRILQTLMKHGERIVSRDALMNELWQSDEFIDDNTLTVNMTRLRKKLEELGLSDFIITKRGQGYRL